MGFLLDGFRNGAEVDDERWVVTSASAKATKAVGLMSSSSLGNEIISFAPGRAPTQHSTPWTSAIDTFTQPMTNTVKVPVTIWIVTGPGTFGAQAVQALSTAVQAGALFDAERLGLDFNGFDLRDATSNPNAPNFANTTSTAALETQIGHVNGRFNIYWVPNVTGGSGNGIGEVAHGDSVAVGMNAAPGLLAHELGHNLALDHVDGDVRFDGTNVMTSNGGTRLFLSEGQAYRAHIRTISAIRSVFVYSLRAGMPIIDTCDINSTTRNCPRADKRIFSDGATFPPN
jgi:hypothetical protein